MRLVVPSSRNLSVPHSKIVSGPVADSRRLVGGFSDARDLPKFANARSSRWDFDDICVAAFLTTGDYFSVANSMLSDAHGPILDQKGVTSPIAWSPTKGPIT